MDKDRPPYPRILSSSDTTALRSPAAVDDPLFPWLALNRLHTLTNAQRQQCLSVLSDAGAEALLPLLCAMQQTDEAAQLEAALAHGSGSTLGAEISRDLAWLYGAGQRYILRQCDAAYPLWLRQIADPPPLLFVEGCVESLSMPAVAVVGSRHPTALGRELARQFATELAEAGMMVCSGLALGIDGAAHAGALHAAGVTVGVMATGPERRYPACHATLAAEVLAGGGALVTELPVGTLPHPFLFPRRNRIISGLSRAVLVIEAAVKSGSLLTAYEAVRQNREVFAVPGSIRNPLTRGCHALIRDGATLVESVQDILSVLAEADQSLHWSLPVRKTTTGTTAKAIDLNPDETQLWQVLDEHERAVDELMLQLPFATHEVMSLLLGLELKGCVQQGLFGYRRVI